jgi:coenzyme F420 biosynthesis associated uncharacterized protein
MLEEYFEYLSDDILQIGSGLEGARGMLDRLRSGLNNSDNWIEGIMTPEQRALFTKLQAVMSIIEGYSNYIMNAVGQRLLPSYDIIRERVEQRAARRSPAEKLFIRITGLALKMEQYKLGESFINDVVEKRGIEFANRVWEGPEMLPTLEELRDPQDWIARVEQAGPAGTT